MVEAGRQLSKKRAGSTLGLKSGPECLGWSVSGSSAAATFGGVAWGRARAAVLLRYLSVGALDLA